MAGHRTTQYQRVAEPVFTPVPEVNSADKWYPRWPDPQVNFRAKRIAAALIASMAMQVLPPPQFTGDNAYAAITLTTAQVFSKTIIYQDIADPYFVEQVEVVTVDKWFNPLSIPKVLVKLRTADYPAFTYGAEPIVSTTDQWWTNFATPPKAKPRATEYLATSYGAAPIVSTPDRWWRDFDTPVRGKRPTPADNFPVYTVSQTGPGTELNWWPALSEPVRLKSDLGPNQQAFFWDVLTPANAPGDGAYLPFTVTTGVRFDKTIIYDDFAYGYFTPAAEIITVDKWYAALSEPKIKSRLRTAEYQATTYGAVPIVSTADRWWRNFDTPPKAKPRATEYPALAFTPTQPVVGKDIPSWYKPFAEPVRFRRAQQQLETAYSPNFNIEIVTVDKWFRPFVDPKTLKKARSVEFPAFVVGYAPIVSTPDRWWQNLATPPKARRRTAEYPYLALPLPYQARDQMGWYAPWTQPKRYLGQRYWEQVAIYPLPYNELVTMDKWFNPYLQPRRLLFGQRVYLQKEFFYYYPDFERITIIARGYIIC